MSLGQKREGVPDQLSGPFPAGDEQRTVRAESKGVYAGGIGVGGTDQAWLNRIFNIPKA
ncbi:MAG: hypothetical protein IPH04_16395 [Saprospirales bacterium]|nr:hypothetical protein [Saprospirales bacterium]